MKLWQLYDFTSDVYNINMSFLNQRAMQDFKRARSRAALQEILARLARRSNDLFSYEEVRRQLHAIQSASRRLEDIPVAKIVGSVGRYNDFTRGFLPRRAVSKQRWARVKVAFDGLTGLPPIEVYQIGDAYFVKDGNHRVSIARQTKLDSIPAYVTVVKTRVDFSADTSPDGLILKAEEARFLEETGFDQYCPEVDLQISAPGNYNLIHQQIEALRFNRENAQGGPISDEEAVQHWYRDLYYPIVYLIRQRNLLESFPGRSETDLYLWIIKHRFVLSQSLNWQVSLEIAAKDLLAQQSSLLEQVKRRLPQVLKPRPRSGNWRKERLQAGQGRLFADLMVILDGGPAGWTALEQALWISEMEAAQMLGLYLPLSHENQDHEKIRQRFEVSCQALEIPHSFAVESGDPAQVIAQRAEFANLVVMPAGSKSETTASHDITSPLPSDLGLKTLLNTCCTPIVITRRKASLELERGLLVYEDSPQGKEALFLGAYMVGLWELRLQVLVMGATLAARTKQQQACEDFLARYGLRASFIATYEDHPTPAELILDAVNHNPVNLLLLPAPTNRRRNSNLGLKTLTAVLARYPGPILICR